MNIHVHTMQASNYEWMKSIWSSFQALIYFFFSPSPLRLSLSVYTLFFSSSNETESTASRQQNMRVKHARLCFIPSIFSHTAQPLAWSCEQEKVTQPQPHLLDFTVSAAVAAASLSAREQLALTLAANLSLTVLSGCVCNQLTLFFSRSITG